MNKTEHFLIDTMYDAQTPPRDITTLSHMRLSYFLRVEPMHFACVKLVEQHGSSHSTRRASRLTHSTQRARQARLTT